MSANTYQKIPIRGNSTTYGHRKQNAIKEENKFCVKDYSKFGRLLKINYINKTGYFYDSCAKDLLQQALAVETEGVSD
jgi:hypothetical protein